MASSDALYLELAADAEEVLQELGKEFTIQSPAGYDPATLTATKGGPRQVLGVVADQQLANTLGRLGGESVELNWVNTKTLVMAASAQPKPNEEVQVDGKWFSLSKLVEVKPADIPVLYMLDVSS